MKMKKMWRKRKLLVIGIPTIAVVMAAVVVLFIYRNRTAEVRTSIEAGDHYLSELDYEQAIASYQQALKIDAKNREANLGLAEAYDANQMYVYAEDIYRSMLGDDDQQADIYERLAELYIRQEKLEEARELLDTAVERVDDPEIDKLYDTTRPQPPVFSQAGGEYRERICVAIEPAGERQTLYYTVDGTEPSAESPVYEKPLILPNGETTVKAIAVNASGYQSDAAEETYDIQIQDAEIELEEYAIERAIRDKLQIDYDRPIFNDDIAQITELYIIGNQFGFADDRYSVSLEKLQYDVDGNIYSAIGTGQIRTLNDLKYMPFLERVVVLYQHELDISGLAACGVLEELSLVGDGLTAGDIAVLSGLKTLNRLNLGWNQIGDISALDGLNGLVSLGLWGNQIREISPVGNLSELQYLDFSDNRVEDISSLTGLSKLEQLWMYHNAVRDISPLEKLGSLNTLMLRDNPIENPEAVRGIYPHLIRLDENLLMLGEDE